MKKKVLVIIGGQSTEHEVSLLSGKSIAANIDCDIFDIQIVGIDKNGTWYKLPQDNFVQDHHDVNLVKLNLVGAEELAVGFGDKKIFNIDRNEYEDNPDIVFAILHGKNGEDGSMQGLFQLLGIPVVGSGVIGSAVGMDKDIAKRLLNEAGIPNAPFLTFRKNDPVDIDKIIKKLGLPLFVKSANGGSSVGVNKVKKASELALAIKDSFKYDDKIIIESAIFGREVECAVTGNLEPKASGAIGEIIPDKEEYYSYNAKYVNSDGAKLVAPADLDAKTTKEITDLAAKVYRCLECRGMARIDFFLQKDGSLVVNEVNTLPGFTSISMFPRLWALDNVEYKDLITHLIDLGLTQ